jgi:hypothetical protein
MKLAKIEDLHFDAGWHTFSFLLFDGPVRERIPVYWSHCGSYRVRNHELVGVPPLRPNLAPRRSGAASRR